MDTQQQTQTGIVVPGQRQAAQQGPLAGRVAPAEAAPSTWGEHSWWVVVRVALSRAALTAVVSLLVWAVLPMALGWTPRVIMSGSMEPLVQTGDIIVTRVVDTVGLERGDVITTVDPDKAGKTRTHRYVQRDAEGQIVTKGDANREQDSTAVRDADVLGQGVLRVPFVGKPAYWLAERDHVALGLAFVVLAGLAIGAFGPRGPTDGPTRGGDAGGARDAHRPARRARARGRRCRRAGVAVTAMVVAGLAASTPGTYAAFSGATLSPASTFKAADAFEALSYAQVVLDDNPEFYWRLEEASGSRAADASPNGAAGQVGSNPRWRQSGALLSDSSSRALGLDGSSITARSTSSVAGAYSAEMWINTTRTSGGPLMGLNNSSSGALEGVLYLGQDGRIRFGRNGTALMTTSQAVNNGAWRHIVYTSSADGRTGRIYVDGVQVATGQTVSGSVAGIWRVGFQQWSGNWPGNPDQYFRGTVDEVAVYDSQLSASDVTTHYRASGR